MGTGDFGQPTLEALVSSHHEVLGVITAPEKPRGRSLLTQPSPIAECATRLGLPILEFQKSREEEVRSHLQEMSPDFLVVVSFGFILSRHFLSSAKQAALNIHPSLLPRHRGASPMPYAILEGDQKTGVTIIRMNERMDAGDIVSQVELPLNGAEDFFMLEERLSALAASLMIETLDRWEVKAPKARAQQEALATYTRKFSKEDAKLDFSKEAIELDRRVRAFRGWPGTYGVIKGKRLLIHKARAVEAGGSPGAVIGFSAEGIIVAASRGALCLEIVQLEGKKQMSAEEFLRGFSLSVGDRFE